MTAAAKQAPGGVAREALFSAVQCSRTRDSALAMLEGEPALWHAQDDEGRTLLHHAALAGDDLLISRSLAAGVSPDVRCHNGQTPLMWAVTKGHVSASRALLDAGADVELKDKQGATPFILSVQHQRHLVFLLLCSRVGVDRLLGQSDANGCRAVHWAAYLGSLDGLRLLAYFDADFRVGDHGGCTPLHRAIMNPRLDNRAEVFRFLVERRAEVMAADSKGRTCLDLARQQLKDPAGIQALTRLAAHRGPAHAKDAIVRRGCMAAWHRRFTIGWLFCVALCVFEYSKELRAAAWSITPAAAALFEVGAPFMVASFAYTAYLDPGIVPARRKHSSGVEDIIAAFNSPAGPKDYDLFERLCFTTWVLKRLRTKYCTKRRECIDEFDHYCIWMNSPIGRGNHRLFVCHVWSQFIVLWCHFFVCFCQACDSEAAHRQASPNLGTCAALCALAIAHPLLALVLSVDVAALLFVGPLTWEQTMGIFRNLTENERINMKRYKHFWSTLEQPNGERSVVFTNPFDKGSPWLNWLDFWWTRTRQEKGATRASGSKARPLWCKRLWFRLHARWNKQWSKRWNIYLDHAV